ncbi:hypothetical protein C8R47DRAFT_1207764 [Mycena vitilis]|nr:hypothetical protein C8R47DRAFT_1207764 [Mycena vitilis]
MLSSSSSSCTILEPSSRRSDSPSFFMHEAHDSFYHTHSRKNSADLEAACLIPSSPTDDTMQDLTFKHTSRRGIYAEYRRWFSGGSPHAPGIQLPLAEKGVAELDPRYRTSKFERRLVAGSWCAMLVLLVLTVYFLVRET